MRDSDSSDDGHAGQRKKVKVEDEIKEEESLQGGWIKKVELVNFMYDLI